MPYGILEYDNIIPTIMEPIGAILELNSIYTILTQTNSLDL